MDGRDAAVDVIVSVVGGTDGILDGMDRVVDGIAAMVT